MGNRFKSLSVVFLLFFLFPQLVISQTCDDKEVSEIDRIKQEVETSLISASTAEAFLDNGEKILAFYLGGSLMKISVDNSNNDGPYFSAEIFFKDGFMRLVAEDYSKEGKFYRDYFYFKDDKLICYTNEKSGDYKSADKYAKAEKKWLNKIQKYLEAIQ